MEALQNIDEEIVLWLNQWAGRSGALDSAEKLIAGDYFILVSLSLCLLAAWFWGKDIQRRDARQRAVLIAMASLGFASLVVLIVNEYYFRPRPFVEHELTVLLYRPTDSSFPAHPAAVAFAIAASMWQANRKLGAFFYGLAILWGLSRVFAGVFYPSDIVVGALIGIVMSYLVAAGTRRIEPIPTLVLRGARMLHLA